MHRTIRRSLITLLVLAAFAAAQTAPPAPVAGGTASAPIKTGKWKNSRAGTHAVLTHSILRKIGHGVMIGLECLGAGAVFAIEVVASTGATSGE